MFPYFLKYILAGIWFIIAIIKLLLKRELNKSLLRDFNVYIKPAILILVITVFCILVNKNFDGDYATRIISNILCMILIICGVFAAYGLFGKDSIRYSFTGLCLATCINVITVIYLTNIKVFFTVLTDIFSFVFNEYSDGSIYADVGYGLEVHDATFAYGFFFLYFLLFSDDSKNDKRRGIIFSLVGLYLGFKRVEVFALLVVIFIYFIVIKKIRLNYKIFNIIFTSCVLVASVIYLYLMKYYVNIFAFLDSSRINLYTLLGNKYEISLLYFGEGYGYLNRNLVDTKGLLPVSHSDLVRMYIELGAIGFFFWVSYFTYYLPGYFWKKYNAKISKLMLCFTIYIFITYLIDNTLTLFATQFCYMLIPIALSSKKNRNLRRIKIKL